MRYYEEEKPPLEDLVHHGVKGMHWGERKSGGTSEILAARDRHNDRMGRLDKEATRLSFAKSNKDKQQILNGIHKIANEKGAHEDANTATRMTRGEKLTTAIVSGGLGNRMANKSLKRQGREAHEMLETYKNSKVSDYYDA